MAKKKVKVTVRNGLPKTSCSPVKPGCDSMAAAMGSSYPGALVTYPTTILVDGSITRGPIDVNLKNAITRDLKKHDRDQLIDVITQLLTEWSGSQAALQQTQHRLGYVESQKNRIRNLFQFQVTQTQSALEI